MITVAALRKTILDFGQTHSHLEGGINKQIVKAARKKAVDESPAALVPKPVAEDQILAPEDVQAEATFSYGPNSEYLAQAVAASSKTNIGQVWRVTTLSRLPTFSAMPRKTFL
jgi:hypothetical protein